MPSAPDETKPYAASRESQVAMTQPTIPSYPLGRAPALVSTAHVSTTHVSTTHVSTAKVSGVAA